MTPDLRLWLTREFLNSEAEVPASAESIMFAVRLVFASDRQEHEDIVATVAQLRQQLTNANALVEAAAGLLVPCRTCRRPATRGYPTAELGYYVYGCDEHRQGPEECSDTDQRAFDMRQAAFVRSLRERTGK